MLFRRYIPHNALSAFVDDFWLYEDYEGEHLHERILPSGTFEMVFNLREDELRIYGVSAPGECRRCSGAVISGPYAGSFMSDIAEEAALLGVHFKPGGAFAVLGMPAGEFVNAHADLRAIWGPSATLLRERLCALSRPADRFRLLERTLLRRLAEPASTHGTVRVALDALIRTRGQARVRDIASAVDLSQRRLFEVFATEVGLTPKLFGRVQRFQHAIALLQSAMPLDWAQLAVQCGYYDQSHLIREFNEFADLSPTDFWRRHYRLNQAGTHLKRNHLPLAG